MHHGWIKIHRKLKEKGFYQNSQYFHLWVHLLLSANHAAAEYMTNGHIIHIKEGQFLTGRELLSKETGIPASTIERILKMLENEQQIEQQKTSKYRLITIVNWKEYQTTDNTSDSKRTANGQRVDTNKNNKKEENEKKYSEIAVPSFAEANSNAHSKSTLGTISKVPLDPQDGGERPAKAPKTRETWAIERKIFDAFAAKARSDLGKKPPSPAIWQLQQLKKVRDDQPELDFDDLFEDWFLSNRRDEDMLSIHKVISPANLARYLMTV